MKNLSLVKNLSLCVVLLSLGACSQGQKNVKTTFACVKNQEGIPTTEAQTAEQKIPIISWTSDFAKDVDYTPEKRCLEVSGKFQKYYDQGLLNYITTGTKTNQNIICVSSNLGGGCLDDESGGQLWTLKPEDNASTIIPALLDSAYKGSGAIRQCGSDECEKGLIERNNGQDYWNINAYLAKYGK